MPIFITGKIARRLSNDLRPKVDFVKMEKGWRGFYEKWRNSFCLFEPVDLVSLFRAFNGRRRRKDRLQGSAGEIGDGVEKGEG